MKAVYPIILFNNILVGHNTRLVFMVVKPSFGLILFKKKHESRADLPASLFGGIARQRDGGLARRFFYPPVVWRGGGFDPHHD